MLAPGQRRISLRTRLTSGGGVLVRSVHADVEHLWALRQDEFGRMDKGRLGCVLGLPYVGAASKARVHPRWRSLAAGIQERYLFEYNGRFVPSA